MRWATRLISSTGRASTRLHRKAPKEASSAISSSNRGSNSKKAKVSSRPGDTGAVTLKA